MHSKEAEGIVAELSFEKTLNSAFEREHHIFMERVSMFKRKTEERHLQFFKETEFLAAVT